MQQQSLLFAIFFSNAQPRALFLTRNHPSERRFDGPAGNDGALQENPSFRSLQHACLRQPPLMAGTHVPTLVKEAAIC
ncbi:MAG: hypothetical protein ACK5YY_08215 [Alphaproteobacteria bacterium]|nr:hypothetical protein [Alphaproteobacteria bacterium]